MSLAFACENPRTFTAPVQWFHGWYAYSPESESTPMPVSIRAELRTPVSPYAVSTPTVWSSRSSRPWFSFGWSAVDSRLLR